MLRFLLCVEYILAGDCCYGARFLNVSPRDNLASHPFPQWLGDLEPLPVASQQRRELPHPNHFAVLVLPVDALGDEELRVGEVEGMREHVDWVSLAELDVRVDVMVRNPPSSSCLRVPVGDKVLRSRIFQVEEPADSVLQCVVLDAVPAHDEVGIGRDWRVHKVHPRELHILPVLEPLPVFLDDLRNDVVACVLGRVEPFYQGLPIHFCIKQMKLPNFSDINLS